MTPLAAQDFSDKFLDHPFRQNNIFLDMFFISNGGFFKIITTADLAVAGTDDFNFIDMIGFLAEPTRVPIRRPFFFGSTFICSCSCSFFFFLP
jgi:hypothetical protein